MDGQQQSGGMSSERAHQQQQQLENQHFFQEYTFKKIASCDVCKDFLRGHMRQGVKCKLCKISCHNDCQTKAHGTIKCQQPKIKLLRRQKSAGELEVNSDVGEGTSADQSERGTSSKPDSIYSLIRQVLDAKKRGQHHAPSTTAHFSNQLDMQQDHLLRVNNLQVSAGSAGGGLASSQMMNLSTGNLALANQNGKSVSTSALVQKPRPESSVDRWSVVMDLLAQSRHQSKHKGGEGAETDGGGGSGKRHSKQLDKFKLAARSVGKHQRYQQASVMFAEHPPSTNDNESHANTSGANQQHQSLAQSMSANVGVVGPEAGAGLQQPTPHPSYVTTDQIGSGSSNYSSVPTGNQQPQQPQQQMVHVHHTKSLPIGQMPPPAPGIGPQPSNSTTMNNPQYDPHGILVGVAHQQQQQQLHHMSHHMHQHLPYGGGGASGTDHVGQSAGPSHHLVARPTLSNPSQQGPGGSGSGNVGVVQPIDRQYQQLLDISLQQQSTSAPHSPQRKRFNLRMKSFSLDSPDGPVVGVGVGNPGGGVLGANAAGAYSNSNLPGHQPQHTLHHHHGGSGGQVTSGSYQQQQQQQQHQHYSPPQQQSHHNYETSSRRYGGQQQQQPTFYYQPPVGTNPSTQASSSAAAQTAGPADPGDNNYNQPTGGDASQAGQQQPTADSSYLNSYNSNELLELDTSTSARHFSSSSNQTTADTPSYHGGSQSTLLRPGGQQRTGGSGGGGGNGGPSQRHQQQHRHSYHSPMSAAAYRFQEGTIGTLMAPGGAGDLFGPNSGDLMPGGRHYASSSALNITAGAASGLLSSASSANKSTKAGGKKQVQPQQQHYNVNGSHPHHVQQANGGRARDSMGQLAADYYDLDVIDQHDQQQKQSQQQQQQSGVTATGQQQQQPVVGGSGASATVVSGDTFVVLYDYAAQRGDEIQLNAGQLIQVLDASERDWWKVGALDGTNRIGYFPSSYLAQLFQSERPLQVAQTIQVSNGETCDKLLRGQIVIHTGKQLDNFVTIRTIRPNASPNDAPQALVNYIQCPEKYLLEVIQSH